ncbi:MAG: adenylyltransferase/cytidyltransferase family protein [Deltaproteobacteria bacterium]|nr:adenylyltransferase/cytidyltransferase family protein [Deltaproteobacteria bacterium]
MSQPALPAAIVSLEEAASWRARWRDQGLTVALVNGAFDLFHVGHLRYLRGAAELADRLIVGVNADASVRALKGEGRPMIPEAERAELIASVRGVDLVHVFESLDVVPLIEALRPDLHVKGTDYTPETVPEREAVERCGGRVAIAGDPKDHSTSELLERLGSLDASTRE